MSRRHRNRPRESLNAWPGYVDALSTLLMVVTFVLLVFVLGQQFLSASLSLRTQSLDSVRAQLAKLEQALSHARSNAQNLTQQVDTLHAHEANLIAQRAERDAKIAAIEQTLADKLAELDSATNASALERATRIQQDAEVARDDQQLVARDFALAAKQNEVDLQQKQITDLQHQLSSARAVKVNSLGNYRSEFFGRLRRVLKGQKGIDVVGDRFVFDSSILFPQGSAKLTREGLREINVLAKTLASVAKRIPDKMPWLLRVDGHADRQPIHTIYSSNWELSAARAITVVKTLMAEGINPHHLAATAFADYQPIDPANTPQAYARNRRIEFRLTDR